MRVVYLAAVALAIARPSLAQLPHLLPPGSSWIDVNYPKIYWTPRDGLTAGAYLGLVKQLSYRDADLPSPYAAIVSLDGDLSTSGRRMLTLEGRFPVMLNGWRFSGKLEGLREVNQPYYGVGNFATYSGSNVNSAQEDFYHIGENRLFARAEVQRQIVGPLRLLAGLHAERWKIRPPTGPSVLASEIAAGGFDPTIGQGVTDLAFRGGLVVDTRNDEISTDRGVLLQAIHAVGGGDLDYTRTTVSAAAFIPVIVDKVCGCPKLGLGTRLLAQGMGGTPRLGSYSLIESSERAFSGLGGIESHRGLKEGRLIGRHKLLFNLDARYHVINLPRTARLTILGFLDAGRVFENEGFSFTTNGLKVGGGTGLFVQLARAGIVGFTFGVGPDGVSGDVGTKWTF